MTKLTRELVDAVGDAFNANNIEAVMQYFAPNATFDHAVGPDTHGARFEGAEVIRGVFAGPVSYTHLTLPTICSV